MEINNPKNICKKRSNVMSLQPSKKKKRKKERKEKQKQILVKVDYFWKIVFQRSRASSSVFIFHEKQRNAVRIRYT